MSNFLTFFVCITLTAPVVGAPESESVKFFLNPARNLNLIKVNELEAKIEALTKSIEPGSPEEEGIQEKIKVLEGDADRYSAAQPIWFRDIIATLTKADSSRLRKEMKAPFSVHAGRVGVDCTQEVCKVSLILQGENLTYNSLLAFEKFPLGCKFFATESGDSGNLLRTSFRRQADGNPINFKSSDGWGKVKARWNQNNQTFDVSFIAEASDLDVGSSRLTTLTAQ